MIRLSYSAASKYLLSPFSYFAHYYLRLRQEQLGSALVFGSALDTGLNSLLEDKRDGLEPDLAKAKAAFCESFLSQEVNGEVVFLYTEGVVKFSKADLDKDLLTDDDLACGLNKSWLSLNRKGQILIEEYYQQVLPRIEKVLLVQHEINLTNESGDAFTGVIDLVAQIDGKIYICDNKSTGVVYKPSSANESQQLATYYEALKDKYDIAGVAFITLSKTVLKRKKPRVDIRIIFGNVSEELIEKTFMDYDKVLTGIKNAEFKCSGECQRTPWGCCYKKYCESGGTDMTGLIYHEKRK